MFGLAGVPVMLEPPLVFFPACSVIFADLGGLAGWLCVSLVLLLLSVEGFYRDLRC